MKSFGLGVFGAFAALVLIILGVNIGFRIGERDVASTLNQPRESAQMQCIHWVDQWRGQPVYPSTTPSPPTFGMYTALCGRPDSK